MEESSSEEEESESESEEEDDEEEEEEDEEEEEELSSRDKALNRIKVRDFRNLIAMKFYYCLKKIFQNFYYLVLRDGIANCVKKNTGRIGSSHENLLNP